MNKSTYTIFYVIFCKTGSGSAHHVYEPDKDFCSLPHFDCLGRKRLYLCAKYEVDQLRLMSHREHEYWTFASQLFIGILSSTGHHSGVLLNCVLAPQAEIR